MAPQRRTKSTATPTDVGQEYIRREARAIGAAHRQEWADEQAALRLLVSEGVPGYGGGAPAGRDEECAPAQPPPAGLSRRRVFLFGGVAVAGSAVVAACKGATPSVQTVPPTAPTTALVGTAKDVTTLRTASSLEALALAVYTAALKTSLVTTTTTQDLLKMFESHHSQHQDLFQRSTLTAGGSAFTDPNPVLMAQVVQPRLAALKTEADVVALAYDVEHMLSATFQADIGNFDNAKWNTTVASVGAAEARHVALLAVISGKSATGTPDNAFQVTQDQVKPGTGV
jgi:hypothetical protein